MSRNCKYGDGYEGLEGEVFSALIRRAPADIPFGFDVLPWYIRTLTRELKFQLKMQGLDETTTFDDFEAVRRSASSINNPAMEDRFVKRLHKEFDEAVKAGKQEGFTVCLVNDDIINWVVKFYGPVS